MGVGVGRLSSSEGFVNVVPALLLSVSISRFTVGNPSMRRPPPINPRDPSSDLYDSCVDNWVDPQIYVIFNDDQSYPDFIIHYEEVPSTVAV